MYKSLKQQVWYALLCSIVELQSYWVHALATVIMEELGKGWVGETTRASIGIFDYVINWVSNISMFSDPETKVFICMGKNDEVCSYLEVESVCCVSN